MLFSRTDRVVLLYAPLWLSATLRRFNVGEISIAVGRVAVVRAGSSDVVSLQWAGKIDCARNLAIDMSYVELRPCSAKNVIIRIPC